MWSRVCAALCPRKWKWKGPRKSWNSRGKEGSCQKPPRPSLKSLHRRACQPRCRGPYGHRRAGGRPRGFQPSDPAAEGPEAPGPKASTQPEAARGAGTRTDPRIGNWLRPPGAEADADPVPASYAHVDPGAADTQLAASQRSLPEQPESPPAARPSSPASFRPVAAPRCTSLPSAWLASRPPRCSRQGPRSHDHHHQHHHPFWGPSIRALSRRNTVQLKDSCSDCGGVGILGKNFSQE